MPKSDWYYKKEKLQVYNTYKINTWKTGNSQSSHQQENRWINCGISVQLNITKQWERQPTETCCHTDGFHICYWRKETIYEKTNTYFIIPFTWSPRSKTNVWWEWLSLAGVCVCACVCKKGVVLTGNMQEGTF